MYRKLWTLGVLLMMSAPGALYAMTEEGMAYLLNSMLSPGRVAGLVETTGDRSAIELTVRKIKSVATANEGPGEWAYEWRLLGEYFESKGDAAAANGDRSQALHHYNAAMTLYNTAYKPDNFFPEERRAYERFKAVRLKMNKYLDVPFKVVNIPWQGHNIVVHLYMPTGVKKPPLVLYTGGIDGSKEVSTYASQGLPPRGIAVAAFDIAGTGESDHWLALPDAHKMHSRILDYFEKTGDFDFNRIGVIGGSYGGYYALQMAVDDSRLKAAVNHCGLVHHGFSSDAERSIQMLRHRPQATFRSALRRFGKDPDNLDAAEFQAFITANPPSLVARGYVGTGKKTIKIPLLTVNGGRDPVSTIEDIRLVEEAAVNNETWLLGHGVHCAPSYMGATKPHIVEWMDEQLNDRHPSRSR